MSEATQQEEVLIVGAGPTGLTLALTLARYGVNVRLVERKAELSTHTKATNVMQRNQELLAALGALVPLQAVGGSMRRLMVHAYGRCFGPRTMRLKESPYSDVILCGQHNFERVVAAELAKAGTQIEFGSELVDLRQDDNGVSATVVQNGREVSIRASFAVGCDGFASVTRRFTRHDFTPKRTGSPSGKSIVG